MYVQKTFKAILQADTQVQEHYSTALTKCSRAGSTKAFCGISQHGQSSPK